MTLLALFCFAGLSGTEANAAQKGVWQAENLEAAIVSEIRGERETKTANKNGNIIEIKVSVKPYDSSRRDLKTKEMMLEGKSIANNKPVVWKLEPIGIGIVGNNGRCFYQFPQALIKGAESISTATAGGFELSKEKEGAPAVVSLVKSPTHICLAFIAPEAVSGKMKLNLANSWFPVSVLNVQK